MSGRRWLAWPILAGALAVSACTTAGRELDDGPGAGSDAVSGEGVPPDERATSAPAPPRAATPPAPPPWLIKHGWDIPRPEFVEDNVAAMEQRGFDGVVIQIGASGDVLSQQPVSYERLRAELAPIGRTRFTTMTHNFVIVYSGDLGSYHADWGVAEANLANLARAAREVGLRGIVYDNENYKGVVWDWKEGAAPTSLREAEQLVMAKGRDMLAAVAAQWPDATLIALIGPWVSEDATADHFVQRFGYNDVAWANELIGPFFLGMASAVEGTDVTLVDGGEVYTPRSDLDFRHAYDWLKGGLVAGDDLVPEGLRSRYGDAVSVGFGVFDRSLPGAPMDPAVWRQTLTNALRTADHYVWAYTELHDWWGIGWPDEPVPDDFVQATAATLSDLGR